MVNEAKKPALIQLRRLQEQHRKLEKELDHCGRYAAYSPSVALREQELKKQKLRNKEMMTELLRNDPDLANPART